MANCQDLVNAVSLIYTAVNGVSINIDAMREKLICIEEVMRQSEMTREFQAEAIEKQQQLLIDATEALTRGLNAIATASGGFDAPPPANQTLTRISASDLGQFAPCSSTLYCPPGLVKDENGNCVEPPE